MNTGILKSISIAMSILTLVATAITGGGQAATAGEVPTVEASYQWVSTQDLGDGTYRVDLDFTVTNTGTNDYTDLTVSLYDDAIAPFADAINTLIVGALTAGESLVVSHTVDVLLEVDATTPMLLIGVAENADGSNAASSFIIMQAEGAAQ